MKVCDQSYSIKTCFQKGKNMHITSYRLTKCKTNEDFKKEIERRD